MVLVDWCARLVSSGCDRSRQQIGNDRTDRSANGSPRRWCELGFPRRSANAGSNPGIWSLAPTINR
jgi:hypothetical protein